MAKVQPKSTPAPVSKESAKADKAKAKEALDASIAAAASTLVDSVTSIHEAEKSRLEAYLELIGKAEEAREENSLERASVVSMLRLAFAEAGEYDADELVPDKDDPGKVQRLHGSDSVEISSILAVLYPKEENQKALKKAREQIEKGADASWGKLLQVARKGGDLKTGTKPGVKAGSTKTPKKDGAKFGNIDDYKTALAGILQVATKSDLDIDEIEEATVDQIEEYKAALEEKKDK